MESANLVNRPRWVDLATDDPEGAQQFYGRLFGWQMNVSDDPQYGGYAIAQVGDRGVAGIGGKQNPGQPTVWSLYIGTDDVDALAEKVTDAGGRVIAPPFEVGDQGRMAVFQDPGGAFISGWQNYAPSTFLTDQPNVFSWAELNARGIESVIPFYERVFGWTTRVSPGGDRPYYEFQIDGQSVLGALEPPPEVPAQMPPYWLIYFDVEDVDAAFRRAVELGAREMVGPTDFPGGRFAIVSDPQGAVFGLLKVTRDV